MNEKQARLHRFIAQHNQTSQSNRPVRAKPAEKRPSVNKKTVNSQSQGVDEITRLKRKVRQLQDQRDTYQDHDHVLEQSFKNAHDDKGINQMEHGMNPKHPENRFDKTYHWTYLDSNDKPVPYSVHIVMKPITMKDLQSVNIQNDYTSRGYAKDYEINQYDLLNALSTMQIAGVKVPDAFLHPEKLNNVNLLEKVYVDYLRWLNSFRRHQAF